MFENMFDFKKFIKNMVDIDNRINRIIKNYKPKIKTENVIVKKICQYFEQNMKLYA